MMRRGRIVMECPGCRKTLEVDRWKGDPATAVRMTLPCDTCHDGDWDAPVFYDAAGEHVLEADPEPALEELAA